MQTHLMSVKRATADSAVLLMFMHLQKVVCHSVAFRNCTISEELSCMSSPNTGALLPIFIPLIEDVKHQNPDGKLYQTSTAAGALTSTPFLASICFSVPKYLHLCLPLCPRYNSHLNLLRSPETICCGIVGTQKYFCLPTNRHWPCD